MAGEKDNKSPAASQQGVKTTTSSEALLVQASNDYYRSMQEAEKASNPAAKEKIRRDAIQKLTTQVVASGLLDETTEIGKKFAKIAPALREKLKTYQQDLGNEAARKSLELQFATSNEERASIKAQIDSQFNLEKSGYSSTVHFAGLGRAVCSFLRACGVDGMDEYIDNFTKEIRAANDSIRDVKYRMLEKPSQIVDSGRAERQITGATDRAVSALPLDEGEALNVLDAIQKVTVDTVNGTNVPQSAPVAKPKVSTGKGDSLVTTTARAKQLAEDAAKEMGLKDPKKVGAIVEAAANSAGDAGKLTAKELDKAEKDLITGVGKKEAAEVIARIKKGAETAPEKFAAKKPALELN